MLRDEGLNSTYFSRMKGLFELIGKQTKRAGRRVFAWSVAELLGVKPLNKTDT